MKTQKELKHQADEIQKKINSSKKKTHPLIEKVDKLNQQILDFKKNKMIGNCYSYDDSYGSGEQWTVYVKIAGNSRGNDFDTIELYKESYGDIAIKKTTLGMSFFRRTSTRRISEKVFNKKLNDFIDQIKNKADYITKRIQNEHR